jgi:tRNA-dihydrouridine synthase
VKQHVGNTIKILGSGDLFAGDDCLRMLEQTGIDGVTVARGAIGNPWIFQQASALAAREPLPMPPTLHQQANVMRQHFALSQQTYTPQRAPILMRKFFIKYSQSHPNHEQVRVAFARLRTEQEFEDVLHQHYRIDGPGRYVPREVHRSQEEC